MSNLAVVFDGNLSTERSNMVKGSSSTKRGSDGDFLVQDLDSVEDLGEIDVVEHPPRTSHHLVIREFQPGSSHQKCNRLSE